MTDLAMCARQVEIALHTRSANMKNVDHDQNKVNSVMSAVYSLLSAVS